MEAGKQLENSFVEKQRNTGNLWLLIRLGMLPYMNICKEQN